MKFGLRKPSLNKRIGARTSWKRIARHKLGIKAPKGMGFLTNPKKASYNYLYNRTTFDLTRPIAWKKKIRNKQDYKNIQNFLIFALEF